MATAQVLYFSGSNEVKWPQPIRNEKFYELFPGVKARRYDSFNRCVAQSVEDPKIVLPLTRVIYYKKNPSLHPCDHRCMNAKGHDCECSCGGKNHGING